MASAKTAIDLGVAQRPFKIFLSLLDKWEIGSPLSAKLAIPSLQANKDMVEAQATILGEEVSHQDWCILICSDTRYRISSIRRD